MYHDNSYTTALPDIGHSNADMLKLKERMQVMAQLQNATQELTTILYLQRTSGNRTTGSRCYSPLMQAARSNACHNHAQSSILSQQ